MRGDPLRFGPGIDPAAPLARANPAAKLAVSLVLSVALLLTVDVVTAGTALVLEIAALPWCGLSPGALARRAWVLPAGAVPAAWAAAFLGTDSGATLLVLGPLTLTEGSAQAGAAVALRILAVGLPGVVLLSTTDPTALADSLAQNLHLPHRFVLAGLAGLSMFGILAEEGQTLRLARRARGLGGGGPLSRLRSLFGVVFALLVVSLRRATVLATAMEARGFGASPHRTWARPSPFTRSDTAFCLGGLALALLATAAGTATGSWHMVLS
ncbi:MAG: energy-coupling factor transport system permease protein [Actinomycetota bacterium]|nr:energy-coupling factor transport system permease protein [Actinomycetota bacterium]